VSILEELTRELAAVKEQLHNLIERNADAVVVVADSGVVRFANPAARRLLGRDADALVGTQLGLPVVVGETTDVNLVNGRVAEMSVVDTEWGGQPALLAVLRDITERKRAAQETAQRERDEFMAVASHELKTPVSTLSATAQLLRRQIGRGQQLHPEQLTRTLDRVHDQSHRLARLVDHLLDASRINAGKLTIEPRLVDLYELVEEVVSSCQQTTTEHTLQLRGPQPLEAEVDPVRIEQVVIILIDNALKYSRDGGDILVELAKADSTTVCLSVRDHGLGVPADRRAQLFERFSRAHTDDHVSGMGLGLFIARHIVELHGGHVTVEAPAGSGSLFTVALPLRQAHGLH
jgi:signal transduction histidine kinase